jgi:Mn2+/Fe2+ NRAMP family transporter
MSGLSGVAQLYGVPVWQSVAVVALLIFLMVASGSYRQVERMAMLLGVAELAFLWMAWHAWPQWSHIRQQLLQLPLHDSSYLYLLAANLGSSVMPWTVFYQQSALIDKG